MSKSSRTVENPQGRGPKPPQPEQQQEYPGSDEQLNPAADHGEETYQGSGRLHGKKAIITGGDSGIGRAAQPAEIAPLFVWLASSDATYITGEVFAASGGKTPY